MSCLAGSGSLDMYVQLQEEKTSSYFYAKK
jgi:hypothetical protein